MGSEVDWSLPQATKWSSLNECLHDATIEYAAFEPFERELTLRLELGFPASPDPFPNHIEIKLKEVKHLLVFLSQPCPSGHPVHQPAMTPKEWQDLQEEYRSKSVAVTAGFAEFTRLCEGEDLEIIQAHWSTDHKQVALDLQGYAERYSWYRLLVSAKRLEIVAEERQISMQELLAVGRSGWIAWQKQK